MGERTAEETATQTFHRLTSYEPGRDWTKPADDRRVVQDLQVNDLSRLPWFFKQYPQRLPRIPLPRELPGTAAPAIAVLAGTAQAAPAALDLPQLSRLLYLAAGVVRTMERPYGTHPFRAAGSAGGRFPSRSTSRCRAADRCRRGRTGTTRWNTRWYRSGRHREGVSRRWSSPACRGAPAGGTASAAGGMCTGTRARCWPNCWQPPTQPLDALLFTCVGVPSYASAAAGPPGAPSTVRMVTPRS